MSDCYIGRKACGCVVAAVVDTPEHRKDVAKTVTGFIRDGLQVERMPVEAVRDTLRRCHCPQTVQP